MHNVTKLAVVVLVLATGICAALQFPRESPGPEKAAVIRGADDVVLREYVPLNVTPGADPSLAGRHEASAASDDPPRAGHVPVVRLQPKLDAETSPPDLSPTFQPSLDPLGPLAARPVTNYNPGETRVQTPAASAADPGEASETDESDGIDQTDELADTKAVKVTEETERTEEEGQAWEVAKTEPFERSSIFPQGDPTVDDRLPARPGQEPEEVASPIVPGHAEQAAQNVTDLLRDGEEMEPAPGRRPGKAEDGLSRVPVPVSSQALPEEEETAHQENPLRASDEIRRLPPPPAEEDHTAAVQDTARRPDRYRVQESPSEQPSVGKAQSEGSPKEPSRAEESQVERSRPENLRVADALATRSHAGEARAPESRIGERRVEQTRRTHKIIDGDSLPALARRYLGRSDRFLEIYEANRHVLPSPDLLPIGAELTIPGSETVSGKNEWQSPQTERPAPNNAKRPASDFVPIPAEAIQGTAAPLYR